MLAISNLNEILSNTRKGNISFHIYELPFS